MTYGEGIDVSTFQGTVDWEEVRRAGNTFAMIKATQGRSEADPSVRLFPDRQFAGNITTAPGAGLFCGVYHYLTASSLAEADAEAEYFLSVIRPHRRDITLWASVDIESRYLPSDRTLLTKIVDRFCETVREAGFLPMIYTNPNFLVYRLGDVSRWDLWLALWRDPTLVPDPDRYPKLRLWQWGIGNVPGVKGGCDRNYAIAPLPAPIDYAEEVTRLAGLSETTKNYLLLYKYGDELFEKLYYAIRG